MDEDAYLASGSGTEGAGYERRKIPVAGYDMIVRMVRLKGLQCVVTVL
jgi:hypothetical protein